MKTIKLLTVFTITILVALTSCQSEENEQIGTNPNANSSTSPTATNYERVAMNDGSEDDFLDGNSCTELLFPLTATINGQQITLISELDYVQALQILAEFNDDQDTVVFNFPLNVRLSNYTEVEINNQQEFNNLVMQCESAAQSGNNAISCLDIDFPITMLTYDLSLEQTGSVVLQSENQLYTFINGLDTNQLFSVNYPIRATLNNGTIIQIHSDTEFQDAVSECVQYEEETDQAEEMALEVESILSNTTFKVESFISAGIDTANEYANYTITFTNELKLIAKNTVNSTVSDIEGTYEVSSELEVFLNVDFTNNTAVSALNNDWIVTTYSSTIVALKSKTDASITLKLLKV